MFSLEKCLLVGLWIGLLTFCCFDALEDMRVAAAHLNAAVRQADGLHGSRLAKISLLGAWL
jgi:hypothetical protein